MSEVTDEELRKAGFSPLERHWPLSLTAVAWMRHDNCAPAGWNHPRAWCYASNGYMHRWIEALARLPTTITSKDLGRLPLPSELGL